MHISTLIITTYRWVCDIKLCTLCTQWMTMDGSGWCLPFHHLPSLYVGEFHLISIWLMGSQGTVVTPYPHPSPVLMQQSSEQEVYNTRGTWPQDALSTWIGIATDHKWNGIKWKMTCRFFFMIKLASPPSWFLLWSVHFWMILEVSAR